ncbi:MAG TPA: hypothetical protein VFC46_06590 [Humisphaera sp.]|nr:hypothetical protein [Humisphaera sp.]
MNLTAAWRRLFGNFTIQLVLNCVIVGLIPVVQLFQFSRHSYLILGIATCGVVANAFLALREARGTLLVSFIWSSSAGILLSLCTMLFVEDNHVPLLIVSMTDFGMVSAYSLIRGPKKRAALSVS